MPRVCEKLALGVADRVGLIVGAVVGDPQIVKEDKGDGAHTIGKRRRRKVGVVVKKLRGSG